MGKRVMVMDMPGERMRGRPKQRRNDSVKQDLTEKRLLGKEGERPGCMETTSPKQRLHIKLEKRC